MVLTGFADFESPRLIRERPSGEPDHIVWSVPPQAAAGLVDRATDWHVGFRDVPPSADPLAHLGDAPARDE